MRPSVQLPVAFTVLLVWATATHAGDPALHALRDARRTDSARPDLVLQLIDSIDPAARAAATEALGGWHGRIPGSLSLLRRLAHDEERCVRFTAVLAAAQIATRDALLTVVDVVDDDWSPTQSAAIIDAFDQRTLRPYWKTSDPLGVRDTLTALAKRSRREHDLKDLLRLPIPQPSAAVIVSGRDAFVTAQCDVCHRVAGYGRAVGPNLRSIGGCFNNQDLIRHIVDPSLDIHDVGRCEQFLLDDGELLVAQIVSESDSEILVRDDPMKVDETRKINPATIQDRRPSPTSPMPTGLLNSLTPTQVADLISFLRSDGGQLKTLADPHRH